MEDLKVRYKNLINIELPAKYNLLYVFYSLLYPHYTGTGYLMITGIIIKQETNCYRPIG